MYGELLQTNLEVTALLAYFEEGLIFSDVHMGIRAPLGLREAGGSSPLSRNPRSIAQDRNTRHLSLTVLTLIIMSPAQERIYFSFTD